MSRRTRKIVTAAIALLPFSWLRVRLYALLPGYSIGRNVFIGHWCIVDVDRFDCGANVRIGRGTHFRGPMHARLGRDTYIGRFNLFECGDVTVRPDKAAMKYTRRLDIGASCLVADANFFDVYGTIAIGDGSWIAGRGSQFWTHGASVMDRDIVIGQRCYVGAMVGFTPGSGIGDDVVVGMGAVVPRRMTENRALLGGVPARKIRDRDPATDALVFEPWV